MAEAIAVGIMVDIMVTMVTMGIMVTTGITVTMDTITTTGTAVMALDSALRTSISPLRRFANRCVSLSFSRSCVKSR